MTLPSRFSPPAPRPGPNAPEWSTAAPPLGPTGAVLSVHVPSSHWTTTRTDSGSRTRLRERTLRSSVHAHLGHRLSNNDSNDNDNRPCCQLLRAAAAARFPDGQRTSYVCGKMNVAADVCSADVHPTPTALEAGFEALVDTDRRDNEWKRNCLKEYV